MKGIKLKISIVLLATVGLLIPNNEINNNFSLRDAHADPIDDMLEQIIASGYDGPITEYESFADLPQEQQDAILNLSGDQQGALASTWRDWDDHGRPLNSDKDVRGFWDIWDDLWNKDQEQHSKACEDGNEEWYCTKGDQDSCTTKPCNGVVVN